MCFLFHQRENSGLEITWSQIFDTILNLERGFSGMLIKICLNRSSLLPISSDEVYVGCSNDPITIPSHPLVSLSVFISLFLSFFVVSSYSSHCSLQITNPNITYFLWIPTVKIECPLEHLGSVKIWCPYNQSIL